MDSRSGIGQSGRRNTCEIPANEFRFEPENVDPRPGGCLDLLKALSGPSPSECFFPDINTSQVCWNEQISGNGFRVPVGDLNSSLPSSRFTFSSTDLNRNFERCDLGDIYWNLGLPYSPQMREDTTGNQNMTQCSPPTPDENKTVVDENSYVANKDLADMQKELQKPLVEERPGVNNQKSSSTTTNQKPKRRKIRPKVVKEGKKQRHGKVSKPKPVITPEIPHAKRKYVRKQKNLPGTSNVMQVGHDASNNNVQQSVERVINIDVEEAPLEPPSKSPAIVPTCDVDGKHGRKRKSGVVPMNTPEIPRVKRKYERKQKKDSLGFSNGTEVGLNNVQQSTRRALNFEVEEATREGSSSKNTDLITECEVDAMHKLGDSCYAQNVASQDVLEGVGGVVGSSHLVDLGAGLSVNRVREGKLQENGNEINEKSKDQKNIFSTHISSCNAQNSSLDNLENAGGVVGSSPQVGIVDFGSFFNLLHECKPQGIVNWVDKASQPLKNVLSSIQNSSCNAQSASHDVLKNTGGLVGPPHVAIGFDHSLNILHESEAQENANRVCEVSESQKNASLTTQISRVYILQENMKALAKKQNILGRQKMSNILEAQGSCISSLEIENKGLKREWNDTVYGNEDRSFDLYNRSSQVFSHGMHNCFYRHPLPVIPKQCKRKKIETSFSKYQDDVSSSLLPSSSNEVPFCEDGQKALSCMLAESVPSLPKNNSLDINLSYNHMPTEPLPRNTRLGVNFNLPSSQLLDMRLIAHANAMCLSQLPSSLSYYHDAPSGRIRDVIEGTPSGVPKRVATKKEKTPKVTGFPLEYPLHKKRKASSDLSVSLHSTPSQHNILKHVDYLVQKMSCLNINGIAEVSAPSIQNENALIVYNEGGTMVPYDSLSKLPKRRKLRAKVDLDSETNRVWLLLMDTANADVPEGSDAQKEKWWEEERRVFQGRAESFIARMHLVQGDRRFSPWKGSVVDSVVGVFLTQNVSDHLSSSAFMNLAARFPMQRTMDCNGVKIPTENEDIYLAEFDPCIKEQERLTKDSIDSEDSGCIKSLDNTVIDLNSVISSLNSSDSPIKEYSNYGPSLQPQIVSSHGAVGNLGLDFNTCSFMELLQTASYMDFFPEETAAGATHGNEFLYDKGKNMSDHIYKAKYASTSTGRCNSHAPMEHNGSMGLPCFSSAIQDICENNFCHVPLESLDVEKENPLTSCANTVGATQSCNISYSGICYSNKDKGEATGQEVSGLTSHSSPSCNSHAKINNHLDGSQGVVHSQWHSHVPNSPPPEMHISFLNNCTLPLDECATEVHQSSARKEFQGGILKNSIEASAQARSYGACELQQSMFHDPVTPDRMEFSCTRKAEVNTFTVSTESHPKGKPSNGGHETQQAMVHHSAIPDGTESSCTRKEEVKTFTMPTESNPKEGNIKKEVAVVEKQKKKRVVEKNPIEPVDWDLLRKQGCNGIKEQRSRETMDSVDWEAIRHADVSELSDCIRERGMNNRLAQRIKEFLDRLVKDHGSVDLEWLRSVPPDKVKDYLLSIKGLGLKSVECVRLLTLHNLAFPVDTNVGRICVRLGWVPLQPLPESLQLHLLELYPILETIQKYLWPRLCKLDQRTLYELHYQMITFGKVFCTKSRPNCNACPMRGECKHFASAFASARLALPGPEEKGLVTSTVPVFRIPEPQTNLELISLPQPTKSQEPQPNIRLIAQPPSDDVKVVALSQQEITNNHKESVQNNSQPIVEEPGTPEPECLQPPEPEMEDLFYEDPDEIPTIKLNIEKFTENLQNIMQESNMELQEADISKALVALTPDAASLPQPKLKNISRLRTEHRVYELPDSHPLMEGLDPREPDDPSPYLLAIWSPGETAESLDLPQQSCSSQTTGILCTEETCSACSCIREERAQIVRGTLLIPCRTAMRGSFPLNGTYFQVNEVFADHSSSLHPIDIPRQWIWNLPRRTVYFGTSVTTIFKGLTTEAIQQCFWRGFVCVRGFDRQTRAPRPLMARLHFPASKLQKNKRAANAKEKQAQ